MDADELGWMFGISELPAYIQQVNYELNSALAQDSSLLEPSKRVISGGKRLRPILVIAAALSQGGKFNNGVASGAAAVELAHLSSLVHDDIMDEADVRRNLPTVNSAEGVGTALMVGDSLLNKAYAQASKVSAEVVYELATATDKMCDAQEQEYLDRYNTGRSIDSYKAVIRGKTALLMAVACKIGGLAADLPAKQVKALGDYGESFGIAFQLIDDVLDLTSTSELMRKRTGNDIKEGVYTLSVLLALKEPSGYQLKAWLAKRPTSQRDLSKMVHILISSGTIEATIAEARRYNAVAASALKGFEFTDVIKGLARLPDAYTNLILQKQTLR